MKLYHFPVSNTARPVRLFIAENSIQTLADGRTITIDLSLASLDPQPLPEALK